MNLKMMFGPHKGHFSRILEFPLLVFAALTSMGFITQMRNYIVGQIKSEEISSLLIYNIKTEGCCFKNISSFLWKCQTFSKNKQHNNINHENHVKLLIIASTSVLRWKLEWERVEMLLNYMQKKLWYCVICRGKCFFTCPLHYV